MPFAHKTTYTPPSSNIAHPDREFARLRQLAAMRSIPDYATMRKDELKEAIAATNKISEGGQR